MLTNQPTPQGFKDIDRVIEEVNSSQTAKALDDVEANLTGLEELRRMLRHLLPPTANLGLGGSARGEF
jgi:hypothetical protein